MVILYGIKNCDTVRKARRWLAEHRVDYRFHDLRSDGLDEDLLDAWIEDLGWEALLNRRGTTWRQLPVKARESLDAARARKLMLAHPAIIKRPLLEIDAVRYLGFSDVHYDSLFSKAAP
jgi:Spx/MgsR family transcriptional regulator